MLCSRLWQVSMLIAQYVPQESSQAFVCFCTSVVASYESIGACEAAHQKGCNLFSPGHYYDSRAVYPQLGDGY